MGTTALALIVGVLVAAVVAAQHYMRRDLERQHRERLAMVLLTRVAPMVARAEPRELLAWRGAARAVRVLYPEIVADLEQASGERFPFTPALVEGCQARWSAEWLAWERQHDAEYKVRVRTAEAELRAEGRDDSPEGRARLASIEDAKLQSYQQRYEEYARIARDLTALAADDPVD